MYVSIIPAIHSIRGVDRFTYFVPDGLVPCRGALVWIPWRNNSVTGIIWEVNLPKPTFAVKPIIQLTDIVLPEQYCQRIVWFAQYYYIALSHAVKIIIPPVLRRTTHVKYFFPVPPTQHHFHITKKILPAIQALTTELTQPPQRRPYTVLYRTLSEPVSIILGLLKHSSKRIAVIVPEEQLAIIIAQACQNTAQPIVVSSRVNSTQLLQAWLAMLRQTHRLFIGTKRLSLFPLANVDIIVQLDPEDVSHKQWDMNPRYHAVTVSDFFSHFNTNMSIIRFSQSPTVAQIYSDVLVKKIVEQQLDPHVTIIDLNTSYDSTYHGLLSPSVLTHCEQNKTIFLWLNKKGSGTLLYCLDCKAIENIGQIDRCQKCGGSRLVKRGHGTTTLVQALRQALPDRKIYEYTKEHKRLDIDYSTHPIIVATSYALPLIEWQHIAYTAVISIDHVLAEPYFRANERALQQLVKLRNFTGQLAVQTYAPEHPVFKALTQYYPEDWYQHNLRYRRAHNLPPFGTFIKAIHKKTKKEIVVHESSPILQDSAYMIDRE